MAENPQAAAARGISPDLVATVNWILGSVLSGFAAILIVNVSGLSVAGLSLLIVPALAAALLGGFRSIPLTLVGGLTIGVLESEVGWLQVYLSERAGHPVDLAGWVASVPFLVIVAVMVLRGRSLPLRGETVERRPAITSGRVSPTAVALAVVGGCVAALAASTSMLLAIATSAAIAVILLSIVVVTGFAGQLSLAQFAFAGFGAWVCAALVSHWDVPFALAAPAGVVATIPLGVLVGLPSLRARGVNLAVITLGLALLVEDQVFDSASLSGGLSGLDIGSASLLGLELDANAHPARYALLAGICLAVTALAVAALRRSRAGRRLIAIRANERAATALGISVLGGKLFAFAISAGIAALGGILLLFMAPTAVFTPAFSSIQSIFAVVYAVIGGVGFVSGAIVGGLLAPGGAATDALGQLVPGLNTQTTLQISLGVGLLALLARMPNGLVALRDERTRGAGRRVEPIPGLEAAAEPPARVSPAALELQDVGVRYGATQAVAQVTLRLGPGEVLGLIGPNGAGKTTVIDAVAGFTASSGRIVLSDSDISRWSARRRAQAGVTRSFQSLELFETMTVAENIAVAADDSGSAVCAIDGLGLRDVLAHRPDELSHGQRRLVAIARAVARRPSVLLLDEPAAGLDEVESAELGDLIRRLADEWGIAVLLVEHDVSLIRAVCDRIVVLDRGRVIATGAPDEALGDEAVAEAYLGTTEASEPRPPRTRSAGFPSPPSPPLATARGLAAGYRGVAAVRGVDLDVHAGEVVAVLGANGAGKTTLLRTLAGELAPIGGTAEVLGSRLPVPLHRLARRGVGFVPDTRAVIGGLSCRSNLRLGRSNEEQVFELFPELLPLRQRPAAVLSGGEQQMIAVGAALAAAPRLLLIDELSLGLAPLIVARLLDAVRRAADQGVGVLVVEQHAGQVLRHADRGLVLRNGRVVLSGSAAELVASGELQQAYLADPAPAARPIPVNAP